MIRRCRRIEEGWLELRTALWPQCTRDEHLAEMSIWLADPDRFAAFLACSADGAATGFAEASIRGDYVNGTETFPQPVGYLEGIYVKPDSRRKGIARELTAAVGEWAVSRGCRELASDADLDNTGSQSMHLALGFEETERAVFFRKWIG